MSDEAAWQERQDEKEWEAKQAEAAYENYIIETEQDWRQYEARIRELNARVAELEAENAKLRAAQEWISVDDRLPVPVGKVFGKYVYVLLCDDSLNRYVSVDRLWGIGGGGYDWVANPEDVSSGRPVIIAWSPLPEPPEVKE